MPKKPSNKKKNITKFSFIGVSNNKNNDKAKYWKKATENSFKNNEKKRKKNEMSGLSTNCGHLIQNNN